MPSTDARGAFIKQQIRSNFCAVYSAAVTLSLWGIPTSKPVAMRIFGARRRGWRPPDHETLRQTLETVVGDIKVEVKKCRVHSVAALGSILQRRLESQPAVLVTANCELLRQRVVAHHAFVVTHASSQGVGIIDSLAKRPKVNAAFNAWIPSCQAAKRGLLHVEGSPWAIDSTHPIYILEFRLNTHYA